MFIPLLDEIKAKVLHNVPDVGMQVNDNPATLTSKVLVVMGGLAMPYIQIRDLVARHGNVNVVHQSKYLLNIAAI